MDPTVAPLVDAYIHFIHTCQSTKAGLENPQVLINDAHAVEDAMAKLNMDADLMQKQLKDGI